MTKFNFVPNAPKETDNDKSKVVHQGGEAPCLTPSSPTRKPV